ncbi:GTPase IMAP family member 8-like [Gambusia affinis]|uniref:GTPase IMAP family member 8-like n=1 Tax=Gambusia affinis TaxID=33528 RepID=UPI001CDC3B2F|nr:GTPase IMAP family member 8-like [Gambusia affinis]
MRRSSSNELLPPNMSEARLVLLGGSWSEKCSVGNLILGNTGFNSREESNVSVRVQRKIQEKNLFVINTPDLFNSRTPEAKLKEQVEHCVRLCSSGAHLFLLVVQPEKFPEETKKRLYKVLELFSDQSFDSALVVIPTSSQRNPSFNQPLQDLIRRCRNNSFILREDGRHELLGTIGDFLVKRNEKQQIKQHPVMKHQRQAAPASGAGQHLRVMLFGATLSTKTQLCNFIIGKKSFSASSLQAKPVEWGKWNGNDIIIVTTPESQKGKVVKEELRSCMDLCPPGPNVLLLVKPSDFTEKDRQTLKATLSLFGGWEPTTPARPPEHYGAFNPCHKGQGATYNPRTLLTPLGCESCDVRGKALAAARDLHLRIGGWEPDLTHARPEKGTRAQLPQRTSGACGGKAPS